LGLAKNPERGLRRNRDGQKLGSLVGTDLLPGFICLLISSNPSSLQYGCAYYSENHIEEQYFQ